MASRMNSQQFLLQMTGCCFALALACFLSTPASAAITHLGTFTEEGNPENGGDTITLTNDAASVENIVQVVIDLSNSPLAVFDESGGGTGSAFDATAFEIAEVGFLTAVVSGANQTLTLTFNDFSANETFTFTIDLDNDVSSVVTGADIGGSEVTATFAITGDLTAVMAGTGGGTADWSATASPRVVR